jgi:pre-mRNA branch site protein p14
VNRILYVRNLPYKITTEELYDIFGKFGALRQVRIGVTAETKGTAYVIYEVINSTKQSFNPLLRTSTTLKMLVIICRDSTCATGIWWCCTTIQRAHSRN